MKITKLPLLTLAHQIEPASCDGAVDFKDIEKAQMDYQEEFVAEEKFDGIRYLLQIKPNGAKHNYLTSRHISVQTGMFVEKQDKVPQLKNMTELDHIPDTILDGEVVCEGISSDTQHAMTTGAVEYRVWDILRYEGRNLMNKPFTERRDLLLLVSAKFPKFITLAKQYRDFVKALAEIQARGGEGLVLKRKNSVYNDQTRGAKNWIKVKGCVTADVIIWGYEETKSADWRDKDWIGALLIGQWRKTEEITKRGNHVPQKPKPGDIATWTGRVYEFIDAGKCSGFDQKIREEISKNKEKFLGAIFELEAHLRLKSLKFRSPRFNRFRHDKNAIQCTPQ